MNPAKKLAYVCFYFGLNLLFYCDEIKVYFYIKKLKEMTNLLGIVFFLQMISSHVPPSSIGVPKLCNMFYIARQVQLLILFFFFILKAIYLVMVSAMCMFSLIGNVFVLILHHRDLRIENDIPEWVRNYFYRKTVENFFLFRDYYKT